MNAVQATTQDSGRREKHYLCLNSWGLRGSTCPWGFPWIGEVLLDRLHGMNKDMERQRSRKFREQQANPSWNLSQVTGAVSKASPGDSILRHPLYLSNRHFPPHKRSSSSSAVMTITPSPPGLHTGALTALQVVRPASETESLRRKHISNSHKYLSQRGMSPCLKYYK